MRPKLLDLYCGAGGAARGYAEAGFDVIGVDINPQKRYPYRFVQGDALAFVRKYGHLFDVIHASPPCQRYSITRTIHKGAAEKHPDLVTATRVLILRADKPYIIENVPGAPLVDPIVLCGTMFPSELKVYRHRLFESNLSLVAPPHGRHIHRCAAVGRQPDAEGWMTIAGHFTAIEQARAAMGIDWMTRDELSQAIPPAYTRYLGKQIMAYLQEREEAAS